MIDRAALARLLADHLPRQRWFGAAPGAVAGALEVEVVSLDVVREPWPAMVLAVVDAGGGRWQLLVGVRRVVDAEEIVGAHPEAVLGELDTDAGEPVVAYDALADGELVGSLLDLVGVGDGGHHRCRVLGLDQSNTSVVFDERVIVKLFRRLPIAGSEPADGRNLDVEVGEALASVGFAHVPDQLGAWRHGGVDRAVAQAFLAGGVDGFHLALTSLHDLFEAGCEPAAAGGDFAGDARRIGAVAAELHLALAQAFGAEPGVPGRWADEMVAQLARVPGAAFDADAVRARYESLREAGAGLQLRVHGDLHLGQMLRTDAGWFVLDFEGEPARPLQERARPSSPLRDVAGMLRSFQYAPAVALREYGYRDDPRAVACGEAWEARNADAFLAGYLGVEGIDELLPLAVADRHLVLDAFVLDKAVYEVGYELAHRPSWVEIPLGAVARVLGAGEAGS